MTMALAKAAEGTARNRPKKERGCTPEGAHTASVWCVIAPSRATAIKPWRIARVVVIRARHSGLHGLSEQRLSAKRFSRPRPETVQCELRFLVPLHVNEDVVVLFFRRLTLPIKVWWIVGRHLDACPPGKDWILFCAATPKHQIFHIIDIIHLRSVNVPVEYHHLHILSVGGDQFVGIVRIRDRAEASAAEHRIVKDNKRLLDALGLGVVQPVLHLLHLLRVFRSVAIPQRR